MGDTVEWYIVRHEQWSAHTAYYVIEGRKAVCDYVTKAIRSMSHSSKEIMRDFIEPRSGLGYLNGGSKYTNFLSDDWNTWVSVTRLDAAPIGEKP